MNSLNNGAIVPTLPAYLKSEIEQIEARLLSIQGFINNPKDVSDAKFYIELQTKTENELAAKKTEHRAALIADLPAPTPLIPDVERATPYPVEQLPPVIRDATNAIAEKVKAPVALAGQCVIGAVVYLALTRANVEGAIGKPMPINTAMLSLADSGDRKSTCHELAFQPIAEQQQKLADERRLALDDYNQGRKGLKGKELQDYEDTHDIPDDVRTLYSDVTFERIAGDLVSGKTLIFWDTDEGGQMLSGHSLKSETRVATIGGMTKLLDRGFIERMRSRGNAEASGTAYQRRFTIHLMAQSIAVNDALNDPLLRGQGLLARFLLTAPESLAGTRTLTFEDLAKQSEPADADPRIKRYWGRSSELLNSDEYIDAETGNAVPPTLKLTLDASRLWLELFNETEQGQNKFEKLGGVKQFAARTGDQARKLAAAFAVFEGLEEVDAQCMRSAVAIVRHSISEWARHSESTAVDRVAQQASDLMEWLIKREWHTFTARDLQNKGFGDVRKSAAKRDVILGLLCDKHHLVTMDGKTYIVNPRAVAGATSATCATSQQRQGFGVATQLRQLATSKGKSTNKQAPVADCRTSVASVNVDSTKRVAHVAGVAGVKAKAENIGRAIL